MLAGDASKLPATNPLGSGFAEVHALLVDAEELRGMLPDVNARMAIEDQHKMLASAFRIAGMKCAEAADRLDAERHRLHRADYVAILRDRLAADEAEVARRRHHVATEAGA